MNKLNGQNVEATEVKGYSGKYGEECVDDNLVDFKSEPPNLIRSSQEDHLS